jgi:hypothetical protein
MRTSILTFRRRELFAILGCWLFLCPTVWGQSRKTENLILLTVDGLRWQEVFGGADARLLNKEEGDVRDIDETKARYWRESPEERREALMPFFWKTLAGRGQVFGNPERRSIAKVTNDKYFSYPGYSEILCGYADPRIESNDKRDNPNINVLEWLHGKDAFRDRIAVFASWDVFPYILSVRRTGLYVNAGWTDLDKLSNETEGRLLNGLARDLPHYWSGVRYDAFTMHAAEDYLQTYQPRVLYVSVGETDDWCHEGRYDLYLDAAWRTDQFMARLWKFVEESPYYRGKTSLIVTTDHGRGEGRQRWKDHGIDYPESDLIWIAALGPDIPALGERSDISVTQSQVAATVADLLGEDFAASDPRIAPPMNLKVDPKAHSAE